jgi:hypothetical protein
MVYPFLAGDQNSSTQPCGSVGARTHRSHGTSHTHETCSGWEIETQQQRAYGLRSTPLHARHRHICRRSGSLVAGSSAQDQALVALDHLIAHGHLAAHGCCCCTRAAAEESLHARRVPDHSEELINSISTVHLHELDNIR